MGKALNANELETAILDAHNNLIIDLTDLRAEIKRMVSIGHRPKLQPKPRPAITTATGFKHAALGYDLLNTLAILCFDVDGKEQATAFPVAQIDLVISELEAVKSLSTNEG